MAKNMDILVMMMSHWKSSMGDMVIAIEKS